MDKNLLQSIVSTGFIKGNSNMAVMKFESRDLHCHFVAQSKTMVCETVSAKFNGGNDFMGGDTICLPDVDSFIKILKTLGNDVEVTIDVEGRNEKYLVLTDGMLEMRYGLLAESQFPKLPRMPKNFLSNNPSELYIDSDFVKKFYKLAGAIKDCKYTFIYSKGDKLHIVLSQSDDYNTGATMTFDIDPAHEEVEMLKFDVKIMKTVLYNNKSMEGGRLQIHGHGLAILQFFSENIKTTYHIIAE